MSINANGSSSPKEPPRLAPAWGGRSGGSFGAGASTSSSSPSSNAADTLAGGGGRFQALATGRRGSNGGNTAPHPTSSNSFSLLSDDNDAETTPAVDAAPGSPVIVRRSSGGWTGSAGKGRSLADLAASKEQNSHHQPSRGRGSGSGTAGTGSSGMHTSTSTSSTGSDGGGWIETPSSNTLHNHNKSVIRYTRERLLSMRRAPGETNAIPESLQHLVGTPVLTEQAQEPVCFDDFDPDEIWASSAVAAGGVPKGVGRSSSTTSSTGVSVSKLERSTPSSRDQLSAINGGGDGNNSSNSNMWRRGVALPPAAVAADARPGSKGAARGRGGQQAYYNRDATDASELWDDPLELPSSATETSNIRLTESSSEGPMMDFSAFGTSLEEVERSRSSGTGAGLGTFDLSDMAEATRRFEEEQRRPLKSGDDEDDVDDEDTPEASKMRYGGAGLTIQSGSGDNVNVFEDFAAPINDDNTSSVNPCAPAPSDKNSVISNSNKDPILMDSNEDGSDSNRNADASSRLMQMIGMNVPSTSEAASETGGSTNATSSSVVSPWGSAPASIPSSNPWGSSASADISIQDHQQQKEAARIQQEEERQRQQQEAAAAAKAHAQAQAQAQAASSQLEIILMERISTILEKSWGGRSDLHTLLSTLHREDHRVINLLQNVDVLRSLLIRHPHRISLVRQASGVTGQEVVIAGLLMSNAQFSQQQQAQQHQEQQARHLQQIRQQQAQAAAQAEAARIQAEANEREQQQQKMIITDAPWYYRDPSGNTQGPFGGREMQQWLQAGYFNGDLPICQGTAQGPFRALSSIFPDPKVAFQPTLTEPKPSNDGAVDLEAKLFHEKQQRMVAEEQQRKKADEEAAAIAAKKAKEKGEEIERQQKQKLAMEQARAEEERKRRQQIEEEAALRNSQEESTGLQSSKNGSVDENSSAQLRMLLGMGAVTSQLPQMKTIDTEPVNSAPPAATPSAWGGASQQGKKSLVRSMSEIQEEEARVAAKLAKEHQTRGVNSGGGWANVAASGAWSGAKPITSAPSAVPVVEQGKHSATAVNAVGLSASSTQALRIKQQARVAAQKKAIAKTHVSNSMQQAGNIGNAVASDNFGENGKMSPTMEAWCKDQLKKLNNGSDDLTLVSVRFLLIHFRAKFIVSLILDQ